MLVYCTAEIKVKITITTRLLLFLKKTRVVLACAKLAATMQE